MAPGLRATGQPEFRYRLGNVREERMAGVAEAAGDAALNTLKVPRTRPSANAERLRSSPRSR